jgi:hypothetical protein
MALAWCRSNKTTKVIPSLPGGRHSEARPGEPGRWGRAGFDLCADGRAGGSEGARRRRRDNRRVWHQRKRSVDAMSTTGITGDGVRSVLQRAPADLAAEGRGRILSEDAHPITGGRMCRSARIRCSMVSSSGESSASVLTPGLAPAAHRRPLCADRALEQARHSRGCPLTFYLKRQYPQPLWAGFKLAHRRSYGAKPHLYLVD